MTDTAPKTQHDFNLAVVEAFKVSQGQIADLQNRASALEDSQQKRALLTDVDGVDAALAALAEAMPAPEAAAEQPASLDQAA